MKALILGVFVAVLAAGPAFADDISYSNATATYNHVEFDNAGSSDNGVGIAASVSIGDTLFVRGSYDRTGVQTSDLDQFRLGIGARKSLNESLDLYGVGYAYRAIVDYNQANWSDFRSYGWGGEVGARFAVNSNFEIRGGIASERLNATDEWETYGLVGATMKLSGPFALVVDARLNDDIREYRAGVQFQF